MIKTGIGYDIHRLEKGKPLFLGGVKIPFLKGLAGHSDGDCLIHAVVDALLGAVGESDIGQHFPDTDPKYKGIRSTELLKQVMALVNAKEGQISNVDTIILAEEPIIAPFIPEMKENLCPLLQISPDRLGIKAKTNEGFGFIGSGKAIAAWAVATFEFKEDSQDE